MLIRKYKISDCEKLFKLFYDTVHSVNLEDYTQEQVNVWAPIDTDMNLWNEKFLKTYTVVALNNDIIIGFGNIDKTGYLDMLFVHKDYQRKHIASFICSHLKKAFDFSEITVHASITSKSFFEKRGYKLIQKQEVKKQGISLENYIMKKFLKK